MSLLESIVLGIVQGLTEFLPISSSAHLRIVPAMLGWEDPGAAFTAVTQLGTEAAVLIYFRHDLVAIATTWLRSLRDPGLRSRHEARMGWYLIVAPERETPGTSASDCTRPTITPSRIEIRSSSRSWVPRRSA